jgi:hypothetical protein
VVQAVSNDLTFHKPAFPDYRDNYQQTVVIPAREAAEAARQAELAAQAQAQAQAQAAYVAPQAPTGSCYDWMTKAGITDQTTAMKVIAAESGCNPYSKNPYSGACGIGQDINGCEVGYDPIAQLIWMRDYVTGRYGTWGAALAHEYNYGWY